MTIKQLGGVFGRNPTFNNVTIEGTLTFDGDIDINSDLTIGGNLDVNGSVTSTQVILGDGSATVPSISFGADTNTGFYRVGSDKIGFVTAGSLRAVLDNIGSLMVGRTTDNNAVAGVTLSNVGIVKATRTDWSLLLNRLTTDGDIALFQKDGTTIGSIGTAGSAIYFGNGTKSLMVSGNSLLPRDGAGGQSSGTVALGSANNSFSDLHLSGAAYAGSLLVGTTSSVGTSPAKLEILGATGGGRCINTKVTVDTSANHINFNNGNGQVGYISTNGAATAYNTSSDQRLKENIADADDAGSKIDAIQVRKFDWKANGSHQDYGMVAQELLEVAPEAVSAPEDPEEMMGVDYSKLVPMMLKEIQSLRARVAQLES